MEKKPIIFRATTQWFASIDKIRTQLLDEIAKVDWIPKWGEQRMHNMIADRGDWCISRQRAWGVPIQFSMLKMILQLWMKMYLHM